MLSNVSVLLTQNEYITFQTKYGSLWYNMKYTHYKSIFISNIFTYLHATYNDATWYCRWLSFLPKFDEYIDKMSSANLFALVQLSCTDKFLKVVGLLISSIFSTLYRCVKYADFFKPNNLTAVS